MQWIIVKNRKFNVNCFISHLELFSYGYHITSKSYDAGDFQNEAMSDSVTATQPTTAKSMQAMKNKTLSYNSITTNKLL